MQEIEKFHTLVDIPDYPFTINYHDQILLIGSCFTENIGNQLEALRFNTLINPFGILYNPTSVANCLNRLIEKREFQEKDLVHHNGFYHSFYHHGVFSKLSKQEILEDINQNLSVSSNKLEKNSYLFITFGTSWIYRYLNNNLIVANCHKIPTKQFAREKLSVNDIVSAYTKLIEKLTALNPSIKLIFTVSPIRHLKDGAIENQRSKATLILSIEELIKKNSNCYYFPSYEIIMDELRDYRFYADDMTHISPIGISHIWEKFQVAFFNKETINTTKKIKKLVQAKNHRPFNRNSQQHLTFLKKQLQETERLESLYPTVNLSFFKDYFLSEINKIMLI